MESKIFQQKIKKNLSYQVFKWHNISCGLLKFINMLNKFLKIGHYWDIVLIKITVVSGKTRTYSLENNFQKRIKIMW